MIPISPFIIALPLEEFSSSHHLKVKLDAHPDRCTCNMLTETVIALGILFVAIVHVFKQIARIFCLELY